MDDAEHERTGESLIGKVARVRPQIDRSGWRVAAAVALLVAAGPGLTIVGARLLGDRVRGEAILLERSLVVVAAREAEARQGVLRQLLSRPTLAATLDRLARALPSDAGVATADVSEDGALRVDVAAPDPDRLRAALRRDPATAGLRDMGQRRGEGVMLVTLEAAR